MTGTLSVSTVADHLTLINRYFWISGKTIMSQQKGVFRVNCIDCLDRTNVVQVVVFIDDLMFLITDVNSLPSRHLPVTFCSSS